MPALIRLPALALAAAFLANCGTDAPDSGSNAVPAGASAKPGAASPAPSSPATTIKAATAPDSPCDWIPAADVAAIVGPLTGTPTRVSSAESPVPNDNGNGCLYTLVQQPKIGTGSVTVQVSLNEGVIAEDVSRSMFGRLAGEFGGKTRAGAAPPAPEGWDSVTRMGYLFMGRVGHVGIQVGTQSIDVPFEKLGAVAAAVRDRVPDQPFAMPHDPVLAKLMAANKSGRASASSSPDPCSLLTRAEVEAVLGPLTSEPYRSAGDSALVDANGSSCAYFTGRHRALVVTPEWSSGKMIFTTGKGLGGLTSAVSGAGSVAVTEPGPWDQAAMDPSGALMLLKGDRLVRINFRTSPADRAGALRLAATAVGKL